MLELYLAFLSREHAAVLAECEIRADFERGSKIEDIRLSLSDPRHYRKSVPLFFFPESPAMDRLVGAAPPSSRAPVMLDACGYLSFSAGDVDGCA